VLLQATCCGLLCTATLLTCINHMGHYLLLTTMYCCCSADVYRVTAYNGRTQIWYTGVSLPVASTLPAGCSTKDVLRVPNLGIDWGYNQVGGTLLSMDAQCAPRQCG
jgi:hypothetical protein